MESKGDLYFTHLEFSTPDNHDWCCARADDGDHGVSEWLSRDNLQQLADWLRSVWGITGKEASMSNEAESNMEHESQKCVECLRNEGATKVSAAYAERNKLVAALARMFPSGTTKTAIEGWDSEWHGCVYIDTPEGQMSWHFHELDAHLFTGLPPYSKPWDGHTTEEKYARLARLSSPLAEIARLKAQRDRLAIDHRTILSARMPTGFADTALAERFGLRIVGGQVEEVK